MGARKISKSYDANNQEFKHNEYYLEESAVRKLNPDKRAYELPQEEIDRKRQKRSSTKSKPDKELSSVSRGACLILIFAIGLTLFIGIDYIKTQTTISTLNSNIIKTEKELTDLKEENRIRREQLNANLDLKGIYNTATKEYGMIRPNENQVIYFDTTLSEFVKQYEEIPSYVETNIIDSIFK